MLWCHLEQEEIEHQKAENKFRASGENQTLDPLSSSWDALFRWIFAIRHFIIERSSDYMHISNLALSNSEWSLLRKNCIARYEGRIKQRQNKLCIILCSFIKRAASRPSGSFCLILPITRPQSLWNLKWAKKLHVNDEIRDPRQTNISPEHCFWSCKQQGSTLKNC